MDAMVNTFVVVYLVCAVLYVVAYALWARHPKTDEQGYDTIWVALTSPIWPIMLVCVFVPNIIKGWLEGKHVKRVRA
jgi:hypothetical protein